MLARQAGQNCVRKSRAFLGRPLWDSRSSPLQGKGKDTIIIDDLSCINSRMYHASAKRDVLPLIAAGSLLLIGRWSWKALNRMDEEWEEYQWQLQQYERERMRDSSKVSDMTTLGVDPGSVYLKLSTIDGGKPELIITSQGDRYRFAGIIKGEQIEDCISGARAMEKFYFEDIEELKGGERVVLPIADGFSSLVKHVVAPAVGEAMERLVKPNMRVVLTLPPAIFNQKEDVLLQSMREYYERSTIVPDPVASIWGARIMGLLPDPATKEERAAPSLVVDIGGLSSSVSLVSGDVVEASCYLKDVGGESYVKTIVDLVKNETGDETLNNDAVCLALMDSSARSAVVELVNKTNTVENHLTKETVPNLIEDGVFSTALPSPKSASLLFASAITKVLEDSEKTPSEVKHVLLVGGGSKHLFFERSFREGVDSIFGPGLQISVVPETALRADITALGASSLLPNFYYSRESGLEAAAKES
ncbi:unnamed protein product [Cylindrotheca closterium]|uniref:Uncharacterized protein n=1 Tax=Cylindrotheca closterium TaxID=2856 RepID=A0AAD2JHG0_9STRA|nr:unnamed protein product [Cylindrotheca closterium]